MTFNRGWAPFLRVWRSLFHRSLGHVPLGVFLAALSASLARAAGPADLVTVGRPWVGSPAVTRTTSEIMKGEAQRPSGPRSLHEPPRLMPNNSLEAPAVGTIGGAGLNLSPTGAQTVSTGVNFTAATFSDCSGWPPDTMGAVGPTQFIVALNGRIRSFSKTTGSADGAINAGTDAFFSPVMTPGSNFTTDPRIRYDRLSGRWFIVMIDVPGQSGTQPNRVMIAVSSSGTITTGSTWSFFQFSGDPSNFADYPTLGIDAQALYIGANIFSAGNGSFVNTSAFVVRKSSLLNGGPIVVTAFTGLIATAGHPPRSTGPYTPQGVDNFDPAAIEGYFIGVDYNSLSSLQLRRVTDPGGTPTLSGNVTIPINSYADAVNVTVKGSSTAVDGLDRRLLAAHLRNGSLWTSHNVGLNASGGTSGVDRNGVRWYQIGGIQTGQTPSLQQTGTIYDNTAAALSYWMGTVMISGQGHAAFGFTSGGPNNYLNAATTGHLASDAAGSAAAPINYTTSATAYNPGGSQNPYRWGDYSYTSLDPTDDMTMWTVQEWCASAGDGYAVQVTKLLAPPPALPTNATPAVVAQGSSVNVTITASVVKGTGFFDPGVGFSNRLSARVNGGGITVNNITYTSPAAVTLNLTVAPTATANGRSVTVINPDGQSITSTTALLTVVPAASTNLPPVLAQIPDQMVNEGTLLTFSTSASDPNGDALVFSLAPGAPSGAAVDPLTGVFTWTPTEAQGPATNTLGIIVTDNGNPSLTATQSFKVVVHEVNLSPSLTTIPNQTVIEGSQLSFTASATDPDVPTNTLTFSLDSGAPAGATVDPVTGAFLWTPMLAEVGTNQLTLRVTDNGVPALSASQTFTVVVKAANTAPVLAPVADQTLYANTTLIVTNTATDADLPAQTLTFSLDPGAPSGAVLGSADGVLTWTPTEGQTGTNQFVVRVTDSGAPNLSVTTAFNVIVLTEPLLAIDVHSNSAVLSWSAIPGASYRVQLKTNVTDVGWMDLEPQILATGTGASLTNAPLPGAAGFYRLRVLP